MRGGRVSVRADGLGPGSDGVQRGGKCVSERWCEFREKVIPNLPQQLLEGCKKQERYFSIDIYEL